MIYKMELSDSTDTMVFDLLEVPIEDKDVTGVASNTTIDGNVFNDYLWLKKQYVQKWSIMCQDEYERLRGFWLRQFGNAEVPFYRLFYGDNVYEDKNFLTSDGFTQILNQTERTAPLLEYSLYGNATQETLSGKNLVSTSFHIATIVDYGENGFILTKPATRTQALDFPTPLPAGTYTFSANVVANSSDNSIGIQIRSANSAYTTFNITAGQTGRISFSTTATGTITRVYFYILNDATDGSSITLDEIQLESGSTATAYEPYVGGSPMPNPDFPSDVNVVSGAQTVKITGKNMWGGFSHSFAYNSGGIMGYTNNADGTITIPAGTTTNTSYSCDRSKAQQEGFYITLQAGTYSVSGGTETIGLQCINISTGTNLGTSFTIAEPTDVVIRTRISSGETVVATTIMPMVEQSATPTAYEPYQSQSQTINLGSIELAGVGEIQPDGLPKYRNSIRNIDGTWYIHKEVGKVVFDGSIDETWQGQLYGGYWRARYDISDIAPITQNTDFLALSDYFHVDVGVLNSATIGEGMFCQYRNSIQVYFAGTLSVQTSAEWRTWLSTHNTTVYYALATPTDTEITDSELVEQLDAILDASLYVGQNNIFLIPSGGAQGEMAGDYRLIYEEETDIIPKTPVVLTLSDGGVINPCGCRQNIQLIMRETKGSE